MTATTARRWDIAAESPVARIIGQTGAIRIWFWAIRRLPLVAYLAVYLVTCYVGALALWLSPSFRALYLRFSGAQPPVLTTDELIVALVLLHVAPALLWAGFELGLRTAPEVMSRPFMFENESNAARAVAAAFLVVSALWATWSMYQADGVENFVAWNDYNAYVYARWRLFDQLGHWEFVNLYTLLPLAAAYVIVRERRWTTTGLSILLVGLLQFPLANRKALLTGAILIGAAAYVHIYAGVAPRRRISARWHLVAAVAAPAALYLFYVTLTLMQVASESAQPFQTIPELVRPPEPRHVVKGGHAALSFNPDSEMVKPAARATSLALYVLFAPLTRTSISVYAYPAIFPRWRPFYSVDVAQDLLRKIHPDLDRFGRMPDDSLVVYHILWPTHHRGSIAAPYQFVLYSQGGVLTALAGSFLMGLLMAWAWAPLLHHPRPTAEASVLGGLVVVFGAFIAIDSIRNSTLTSYGLLWGALPIVLLAVVYRYAGKAPAGARIGA